MPKKISGFTILEIVIVMVVMGIVLSMTMNLGREYTQRVRFQQEKEQFLSAFSRFSSYARSSNLAADLPYQELRITLKAASIDAVTNTDIQIGSYMLQKSSLVLPLQTYTLLLIPYGIGCSLVENPAMQEVEFDHISAAWQWKACFSLVLPTCTIQEHPCK